MTDRPTPGIEPDEGASVSPSLISDASSYTMTNTQSALKIALQIVDRRDRAYFCADSKAEPERTAMRQHADEIMADQFRELLAAVSGARSASSK